MRRAIPWVWTLPILVVALVLTGCVGPDEPGRVPGIVTAQLWLDADGRIDRERHQDPDLFVGDRLRWECANCPEGVDFEVTDIRHTAELDADLTYLLSSEEFGLGAIAAAVGAALEAPAAAEPTEEALEAPLGFADAVERIDALLAAASDMGKQAPEGPRRLEAPAPDDQAASCLVLAGRLHALLGVLEAPMKRPDGVPDNPFGDGELERGDGYLLSPAYPDIPGDHLWKFTWVLVAADGRTELDRWDPHFSGHGGDTGDWESEP